MAAGNLSSIPSGEKVYVDSNILTYHILIDPVYGESCRAFINRVEDGEIDGYISPIVVSETLFNFIKASVVKQYNVRVYEVISLLKSKPEIVGSIDIEPLIDMFELFNFTSITKREVEESYGFIRKYSLLTNDALHAACCKTNGIRNIATNDYDFDKVENLRMWTP